MIFAWSCCWSGRRLGSLVSYWFTRLQFQQVDQVQDANSSAGLSFLIFEFQKAFLIFDFWLPAGFWFLASSGSCWSILSDCLLVWKAWRICVMPAGFVWSLTGLQGVFLEGVFLDWLHVLLVFRFQKAILAAC